MNFKRFFQFPTQTQSASFALLVLRIVAGAAFFMHGSGKMQNPMAWMGPDAPIPGFLQFLAAFSEFGGGIAWILGLLTPLASLGVFFTMAVAVYTHAITMKNPFVDLSGGHSYEIATVYLAISLVLFAVGPGKFSIDSQLFGKKD